MRNAGSFYFSLLFRLFTGKNIPDPTSGFVCFHRDIAEKISRFFPSDFPEIEMAVLLIRAGYEIIPFRVEMRSRQLGVSSINFVHSVVYLFSVTLAFFNSFIRNNPYSK